MKLYGGRSLCWVELSIWLGLTVVMRSEEVPLSYIRRIFYDYFLVPTLREPLLLEALDANMAFLFYMIRLRSFTNSDASTITKSTSIASRE